MKFFEHWPIIALTSDASVDFTPESFDTPLGFDQRAYLKAQTGRDIPQVFWRKQIHEDGIILAQGSVSQCRDCPDADAFVTKQEGLPIAIRTADCVPVFLFDPIKKAIGLAHAGWRGTKAQIAAKTIQTMRDKFGSQCYDLHAALGPAIRSCCYQVGPEFRDHFPEDVQERQGHLYLDVIAANRRQLVKAGVLPEHIADSGVCTCCSQEYFSFRRDGVHAGRMISVMMLG
jgi:YfiH family protein